MKKLDNNRKKLGLIALGIFVFQFVFWFNVKEVIAGLVCCSSGSSISWSDCINLGCGATNQYVGGPDYCVKPVDGQQSDVTTCPVINYNPTGCNVNGNHLNDGESYNTCNADGSYKTWLCVGTTLVDRGSTSCPSNTRCGQVNWASVRCDPQDDSANRYLRGISNPCSDGIKRFNCDRETSDDRYAITCNGGTTVHGDCGTSRHCAVSTINEYPYIIYGCFEGDYAPPYDNITVRGECDRCIETVNGRQTEFPCIEGTQCMTSIIGVASGDWRCVKREATFFESLRCIGTSGNIEEDSKCGIFNLSACIPKVGSNWWILPVVVIGVFIFLGGFGQGLGSSFGGRRR